MTNIFDRELHLEVLKVTTLDCQINVLVRLLIFRIFPIGTDLFGMVRLLILLIKPIGTFIFFSKNIVIYIQNYKICIS